MKWVIDLFTSSLGRKLLMALTGLFLITFLVVHLAGNLQLLKHDGGEAFNVYARFMTTNPVIKSISYVCIRPALENKDSTGTEVSGMQRKLARN